MRLTLTPEQNRVLAAQTAENRGRQQLLDE
jgi:hypothetical protein